MKKIHQKRLARLAIALLQNYNGKRLIPPSNREMIFKMAWWSYDEDGTRLAPDAVHTCGTSCCFLGYAPIVMPVTRKMTDWADVGEWVIGAKSGELTGFLFGAFWPSIPHEAAARALFALRNLDMAIYPVPHGMNTKLNAIIKMSHAGLLRALAKFV